MRTATLGPLGKVSRLTLGGGIGHLSRKYGISAA